jgi:hypothetical protein
MPWKRMLLKDQTFTDEDTSAIYSGHLHILVETDAGGSPIMGADASYRAVAAPSLDASEPLELANGGDKPGLMKEFAVLFGDKATSLQQERDDLQKLLEQKDRRIEELERLNTQAQTTLTDSFKALVNKMTKGKA